MKTKLSLIGFLILLISVPVTLYMVHLQQGLSSKATPATTLKFDPTTVSVGIGEQVSLNIMVDTSANEIISTDLVITYNPVFLEAVSIAPGSFWESPTQIKAPSIDNTNGKIIYSFYTTTSTGKSGSGTLAIVTFKGKSVGDAMVSIDPSSLIYGAGEGNVLTNPSSKATITVVNSANPTATPTPTTINPTPTPTNTQNPPQDTPTPTMSDNSSGEDNVTLTPTPLAGTNDTSTALPTQKLTRLPETGDIKPLFIGAIGFLVTVGGIVLAVLSF